MGLLTYFYAHVNFESKATHGNPASILGMGSWWQSTTFSPQEMGNMHWGKKRVELCSAGCTGAKTFNEN